MFNEIPVRNINQITRRNGKAYFKRYAFFITLTGLFCGFILSLNMAWGEEILTASWYSIESLKKEGTYKYSKGVMANGQKFSDNDFVCATRLFPLGCYLLVTNLENKKSVVVKVTDRIGKRFAKTRVDLSKKAFSCLAELDRGIIKIKVERIK